MFVIAIISALVGLGVVMRIAIRQFCSSDGVVMTDRDLSREERFMKRFEPPAEQRHARVTWDAAGEKRSLKATVLDLSEEGARIKTTIPLPPETRVVIQMPGSQLAGTARVRYCEQKSFTYWIGLEFKGPLFRMP